MVNLQSKEVLVVDNDRLKHSYAVANKMIELGKEKSLSEIELQELFLLGYLHDIGYEFGTNENHNRMFRRFYPKGTEAERSGWNRPDTAPT